MTATVDSRVIAFPPDFIEIEGSEVARRDIWPGEFPELRESKTFRAGRLVRTAELTSRPLPPSG